MDARRPVRAMLWEVVVVGLRRGRCAGGGVGIRIFGR